MRGPTPRRKKEFSGRLNQRARDVELLINGRHRKVLSPQPIHNQLPGRSRRLKPCRVTFEKHFEVRFRTTYETFHSAQHAIPVFHSTHPPHTSFPFRMYVSPIAES